MVLNHSFPDIDYHPMPLYQLNETFWFPPVTESMEDGLLAIGGDLQIPRLLTAYKKGIFPWYEGNSPLWWCPDPRFVLFPNELKISKSMQVLLKKNAFEFSVNQAFHAVIKHCKITKRNGQDGTWITDEMLEAYTTLHQSGWAHSAEVWQNGQLVGGLYGIKMGNIFFGESMFSLVSNASKFAFIRFVQQLMEEGIVLIDCQVYTEHLESLGAQFISRENFTEILSRNI
ncbi:leucyl/phenylalanyl-tRNA--protein transferase [Hydrotalea sp. AMD]|uniref:leucyl/phenylalanyl-tRNA--protein transferase n=1 Tax=Hydrotalea sp. AMD TaxID=2501297 RepID=UPI00257EF602|nr:leucyl/phenylalanyl-tRNA--protein transferase [Hydrotalea sp. AMD]